MEPHTTIAQWTARDEIARSGRRCQHPFLVRAEIADLFGLPVGNVRITVPFLGGGFGSKSYTKMEPITRRSGPQGAAAGADRQQRRRSDGHHPPPRHERLDADGRDGGRRACWPARSAPGSTPAPTPTTGRAWSRPAPTPRRGPIAGTAVKVDAWGVYTNTSPAGSYRAFGATHLQWCGEAQIDEIGRRCGLDAMQMREKNLLRPGESVRPGGKPLDADLIGDIRLVAAGLDWDAPKPRQCRPGRERRLAGGGRAPGLDRRSSGMEADGMSRCYVSSTEVGQGARTVFSQIVAEELALPVEQDQA